MVDRVTFASASVSGVDRVDCLVKGEGLVGFGAVAGLGVGVVETLSGPGLVPVVASGAGVNRGLGEVAFRSISSASSPSDEKGLRHTGVEVSSPLTAESLCCAFVELGVEGALLFDSGAVGKRAGPGFDVLLSLSFVVDGLENSADAVTPRVSSFVMNGVEKKMEVEPGGFFFAVGGLENSAEVKPGVSSFDAGNGENLKLKAGCSPFGSGAAKLTLVAGSFTSGSGPAKLNLGKSSAVGALWSAFGRGEAKLNSGDLGGAGSGFSTFAGFVVGGAANWNMGRP